MEAKPGGAKKVVGYWEVLQVMATRVVEADLQAVA